MSVMKQAEMIRSAMDAAAMLLTDAQALGCKAIYKQWEALAEAGLQAEKGFRFLHGDALYRTEQPVYVFSRLHVPGAAGTGSLFSMVDETHGGTEADPIPYAGNMALEEGKYYSQGGAVYRCIRSTEIPVYAALSELVGLFVEAL